MPQTGFQPQFNLSGGQVLVRHYGITAAQEWDVYDALNQDGGGSLIELASAAADLLGFALEGVGNVTTGQSDAAELESYLEVRTTGKISPVAIAHKGAVFLTDDQNSAGTAAVTDIGEGAVLELTASEWGIDNGTATAGSTPSFIIVDIERDLGQYFVLPDDTAAANIFSFIDALV